MAQQRLQVGAEGEAGFGKLGLLDAVDVGGVDIDAVPEGPGGGADLEGEDIDPLAADKLRGMSAQESVMTAILPEGGCKSGLLCVFIVLCLS